MPIPDRDQYQRRYVSPGQGTSLQTTQGLNKRLTGVENLTKAILWVSFIALFGVFMSAFALVIDQMHFNNQTYRDQSRDIQKRYDALDIKLDEMTKKIEILQQK